MSSTNENNMWIFWLGLGVTMGFFAFTDIGKEILGEGEKAAVKRVKEKGIHLPKIPGWGIFDTTPSASIRRPMTSRPTDAFGGRPDWIRNQGIEDYREKVWEPCLTRLPPPYDKSIGDYMRADPKGTAAVVLDQCAQIPLRVGTIPVFPATLGMRAVPVQGEDWNSVNYKARARERI